ncbi:conserved exported hypothetical protein [Capnocytophaga canimorsus]|nr:SusC/RagA family TonB-linked outer membrane protein [Capnocytophaga canimorsus]CEN45821.1 conserved exported hypothetical protein [Capnocytophaga canimorsus]
MKFIQHFICTIVLFAGVAYGQNERIITGNVTSSSDKMPLPGASVFIPSKVVTSETAVKGILESVGIGVVADFDGNFTISVPQGTKQLAVSFIGFETKIITLSEAKNHYNIALEEETNALQEVVVTGYQKIEKRKLTSAVVKVDSKDIIQAGVASIDQLLQGQVAGMVTTVGSGAPGELAKIRIRGTASLSGSQDPLWVVDGLPLEGNEAPDLTKGNIDELKNYSIAGINPDDIQDITILKDAAATAIYGARAANGVIVVTTKKGKKGNMKINISANTFVTQRPDFDKLNLMNANEKVDFELYLASRKDLTYRNDKGAIARILKQDNAYDTYQNQGFSALPTQTQQAINALRENNAHWDKLLYRNAFNKQYTASISGGNDQNDYYFSLGYYDEEGTTTGTGFQRYNLSLNNTFRITDKFKIGTSVLASQTDKESYLSDTDRFTNPSNYSRDVNPYFFPYDEKGHFAFDKDIQGYSDRYVPFNLLQERQNTAYTLKNLSLKAILDLEYKIWNNLTFVSQFGLQRDQDKTEKFANKETYFTRKYRESSRYYDSSTRTYKYFLPEGGIIQNWNSDFFQYNWKNTLQYALNFNNLHEIDLLVGSELRYNQVIGVHTKGFGFNEKNLTTQGIVFNNSDNANSSLYRTYLKNDNENAFVSFYATGSYTYNRKYTIFGSLRSDGSNLFGVDPKYRYLPLWSLSGSWLVSEESFLKDNTFVPYLRLRASYGFQGNIDKNTSPFVVGNYQNHTFLPGYNQSTINVTSPPNNKLRWEKTENYNVGFDAGFFNNRIRLAGDWYQRKSTDLIGLRALPLENGFNSTTVNWAQVSNKGYEISLSTQNIKTDNFDWKTTISFSHNKSHVDRIQVKENDRMPSREGLPVNAIFALKTNGLDANGLPQFIDKEGKSTSIIEHFKLYDPWELFLPGEMTESKLTPKEIRELYTFMGDRDPKFSGGIINTFRYGNIDLTINANFNLEQTMVRTAPYNPAQIDRGLNYSRDVLNAWTPDNQQTHMPRIIGQSTLTGDDWMAYKWLSGSDATYGMSTIASLDTWVKQMSYLRISSIRLGYTLPQEFSKRIGFDNFRLSIEGRNLMVFSTDYSGFFDPETYGNIYAQPLAKSLTVGLNLSF